MLDQTVRVWMSKSLRAGALTMAVTCAMAAPSLAQEEKSKLYEKAMAVLKAMSDYVRGATTVSFRTKTFFDVVRKSGIKIKSARAGTVMLKRPNHLHVNAITDDGSATTAWFDGSKLTIWRRSANEVMSLDFSGSTDQMLDHLIEKHEVQLPLADLLYSDLDKTFGDNLISSEYIGLRVVDGVPCHQLSFESQGADWQIWIEADSTPLPRRFVIDFVNSESQPQFMARLNAWSIGGTLEDFNFAAAVPEGVKRVEFKPASAGKAE